MSEEKNENERLSKIRFANGTKPNNRLPPPHRNENMLRRYADARTRSRRNQHNPLKLKTPSIRNDYEHEKRARTKGLRQIHNAYDPIVLQLEQERDAEIYKIYIEYKILVDKIQKEIDETTNIAVIKALTKEINHNILTYNDIIDVITKRYDETKNKYLNNIDNYRHKDIVEDEFKNLKRKLGGKSTKRTRKHKSKRQHSHRK